MNKIILILLIFFTSYSFCNAEIVKDSLVDETLNNIELQKPLTNIDYNYQSIEKIPIKLQISEKISTKKNGVYDAQPLVFYAKKDVRYKGKTIVHKGDEFTAVLETYMDKGMNGIPAVIIVDKFSTKELNTNKIKGTYIKKGFNASLFVYPLKWALTPIPGVGSLTNFILGGSASITPKETITIYYYPHWDTK